MPVVRLRTWKSCWVAGQARTLWAMWRKLDTHDLVPRTFKAWRAVKQLRQDMNQSKNLRRLLSCSAVMWFEPDCARLFVTYFPPDFLCLNYLVLVAKSAIFSRFLLIIWPSPGLPCRQRGSIVMQWFLQHNWQLGRTESYLLLISITLQHFLGLYG